jgi:propionyl-CoA:succinyl-CoA transferase
MTNGKTYPTLTADEAASLIPNGAMLAVSGFTPAGAPKAVPKAVAKRARESHEAGKAFQVKLLSPHFSLQRAFRGGDERQILDDK